MTRRDAHAAALAPARLATQVARLVQRIATPVILIGSTWLWWELHLRGYAALSSTLIAQAAMATVLLCLEQVFRHPEAPPRPPGSLLSDIVFSTVTLGSAVLLPALCLMPLAWTLSGALGSDALWPRALPFAAQVGLALLIVDGTSYLWHRLQHRSGESWMWRLHSIHHAPTHFDFWMGGRVHPLDVTVFSIVGYGLVAALGTPEPVLHLTAFIASVIGAIHHTSLDTDCGVLNRLIPFADHHVMHHSRLREDNGNFGNITTLFDQLLGSYIPPRARSQPPLGAFSLAADYPQARAGFQLLSPFGRYWQRARGPAASSASGIPRP